MTQITEEAYRSAIPAHCEMTFEQHVDGWLCWGLAEAVRNDRPMNCGSCMFRKKQCISCGSLPDAYGQFWCECARRDESHD